MSKRARLYANVVLLIMLFMLSVLSLLLYINFYPRVVLHLISDDELYDSIDVKKGGIVPVLPKPTKTGATFSGWYYDKDCIDPYDYDQKHEEDLELYAKYDLVDYTLTFYVENTKNCYEPVILNYGDLTKLPTGNEEIELNGNIITLDDYKLGYEFDGWSTSPSSKRAEYAKGSFFEMLPSNVDLYAIWKPESFSVIYRTQGLGVNDYNDLDLYLDGNNNWVLSYTNTNVSDVNIMGYEYESKIQAPAIPIDPDGNFLFGGWYLDEEFTKGVNYTQTYMGINEFTHSTLVPMYNEEEYTRNAGHIVLFAKWYAVAYEIEFQLNLPSGSFASGIDPAIVTIKDGVQTLRPISNVYNRMSLDTLYTGDVFADKILYTSSGKVSHAFNSWNTSPDGTGSKYNAGTLFNKNDIKDGKLTLYGTWDEYYYINYLMNSSQSLYSQKILLGQAIKLPHISEFEAYKPSFGYTFSKWMDTQVYDESRTKVYEINKTYTATNEDVIGSNLLYLKETSKSVNLYAVNDYNNYTIDYDLSLWTTSDGVIYDQLVENHDGKGVEFINESDLTDNEKLSLNIQKEYNYVFGNSSASNQHVVLTGSVGSMSYAKYNHNGTIYLLDKWLLLDENNEVVDTINGETRISFTSINKFIENAINQLSGGKPTKNYTIKLAGLWVREVVVTFATPNGEEFHGKAPEPCKFMSGKYVEFHKLSDVTLTRDFHQFMGWGFDGQRYDGEKVFYLYNDILYIDAEHTIETTFAPYGGTTHAGGILYDDVTVYPVWKPLYYTLNIYNSDINGNQASQICSLYISIKDGSYQQQRVFDQVTLGYPIVAGEGESAEIKNFTYLQQEGYSLIGWKTPDGRFIAIDEIIRLNSKVDGAYIFNPLPTSDQDKVLSLTANYGIKTYDVTISTEVEGVIGGTTTTREGISHGTTLKSLLQTVTYQLDTANGYVFKAWHVKMGESEFDITNVSGISESMVLKDHATITLVVEVQKYSTRIIMLDPNTSAPVNEYQLDIPHGKTISQFLTENTGISFTYPADYEGYVLEGFTDKSSTLYTLDEFKNYKVTSINTFITKYSPKDVVVVYTNTANNATSQDADNKYGDDIALQNETSLGFVNDGYRLTGWSLTNGGEKFASVGDVLTLTNADNYLVYNESDGKFYLTIYSVWEQLVTLYFDIPAGVTPSVTLSSADFIKGSTISISQVLPEGLTFTNLGYEFTGKWILDGDTTNTVTSKQTFTINEDMVACPEFSSCDIKITYYYTYSGETSKHVLDSEEFAFGTKDEITLPATIDSIYLQHNKKVYVPSHWEFNSNTYDLGAKFTIDADAIRNNDGKHEFVFTIMLEQQIKIIYNHNYTDAPDNIFLYIIVNRTYTVGDYNDRGENAYYSPTRTGYEFIGWNTSPTGNGTSYTNGDEYSTSKREDTILYATWQAKQVIYVLHPNYDGGTEIGDMANFGETITLSKPASFVNDGYRMIGWSSSANGSVEYSIGENYVINSEETVILYAVWTKEFVVKYVSGSDEYSSTTKYVDGDTYTILNLPVSFTRPEGKGFAGWDLNGEIYNPGETYTIASADASGNEIVFTCVWSTDTFTVSVYHMAESGEYELLENANVEYNSTFTLSNTPNLNITVDGVRYGFVGYGYSQDGNVEINSTNGELSIDNVRENVVVYAIYNEQVYLTYLDENGDEISKTSYKTGTTLGVSGDYEFETTTKDGHVHVAWQDESGKTYKVVEEGESGFNYIAGALTLLTLTKDTTLTPVFAKPETVKIYTTISTSSNSEVGEFATTDVDGTQVYFGGLNTISVVKGDSVNIARNFAGTTIYGWVIKTDSYVYTPTTNVDYNGNEGDGASVFELTDSLLSTYDSIELLPIVYVRVNFTSSRDDIAIDDYEIIYAGEKVEVPQEYYNQNYYLDAWEDEDGYVFDFDHTRVYEDITLTALFGHFYSVEYFDDDIANKYLLARNDLKKNDTITLASERNVVNGQNINYIKQGYTIQGWRLIHNGSYFKENGDDVVFGLGSSFTIDMDRFGSFLGSENYAFQFEPVWLADEITVSLVNANDSLFNLNVTSNNSTSYLQEFTLYYGTPFTVNGNVISFVTKDGESIRVEATLKSGAGEYTFTAWMLGENAVSSGDKLNTTEDVTLSFTYSAGNVTLTVKTRVDGVNVSNTTNGYFQVYGESAYGNAQYVYIEGGNAGEVGAKLRATAGDNYNFVGWYMGTDANGSGLTEYSKNAEIELSGLSTNTYIFAVFMTSTYKVHFYGYGVDASNVATRSPFKTISVSNGLAITTAQLESVGTPTTDGYVFEGWDYDGSQITSETNIYSTWRKYYSVEIEENETTTTVQNVLWHRSTENFESEITLGGKSTTITLPTLTKTGYDFACWIVTGANISLIDKDTTSTTLYVLMETYEDGSTPSITITPVWEAKEIDINLENANSTLFDLEATVDGTESASETFSVYYDTTITVTGSVVTFENTAGETVSIEAVKTQTGDYNFGSWTLNGNTVTSATVVNSTSDMTLSFTYSLGEDISLVARVMTDNTFVTNTDTGYIQVYDGTYGNAMYDVTLTDSVGQLGARLRATAGTNYIFEGWYKGTNASGSGMTLYNSSNEITLSDLTTSVYLFAKFRTDTYKVYFYGYGVTSSNVNSSTPFKTLTISNGEAVTETQLSNLGTPTTTNKYVFEGWDYDGEAITAETRIYSTWRKYYTVTIIGNTTTTQNVLWHRAGESGEITLGGKSTTITLPTLTKTGYDFACWIVTGANISLIDKDTTSTTLYDLMETYEDGSTPSISIEPVWDANAITVTMKNEHSDLFDVTVNGTKTNEQSFELYYDTTFTVSSNSISFKTTADDAITIVAKLKADAGEYVFNNWKLGDKTLVNNYKLDSTTDVDLTFTYSAGNISLVVKARVDGYNATDTTKGYFQVYGTSAYGNSKYSHNQGGNAGELSAKLKATAGEDYEFKGWYLGDDEANNLTLYTGEEEVEFSNLTTTTYVYAVFSIKQTSFTFKANDQADVDLVNNFELIKLESIAGSISGSTATEYTFYDGSTNNINKDLVIKVNRGNALGFTVKYKSSSYVISGLEVKSGSDTETLTPTITTSGEYTLASFTFNFSTFEQRTLKLTFIPSVVSVYFYGEDPSNYVDAITVNYGDTLSDTDFNKVTTPTHSGHFVFENWDYDGSAITEDTDIYAIWRAYNVVTFGYDESTSQVNALWHRSTENSESEITLGGLSTTINIPNVAKSGYEYYWNVTWNGDSTGTTTISSDVTSFTIYDIVGAYSGGATGNSEVNVTFSAVYSELYTLRFMAKGQEVSVITVSEGSTFTTPPEYEIAGYEFVSWQFPGDVDANETLVLNESITCSAVDNVITIQAFYREKKYAFQFTSSDLSKGGIYDSSQGTYVNSQVYYIPFNSQVTITSNGDNTAYTISFSGALTSTGDLETRTITLQTANYYLDGLLDINNGNGVLNSSFTLDNSWLSSRANESAINEYQLQFSAATQKVNVTTSMLVKKLDGSGYETNVNLAQLTYDEIVDKGSTLSILAYMNTPAFTPEKIEYTIGDGETQTITNITIVDTYYYTFTCVADGDVNVTFYFTRAIKNLTAQVELSNDIDDVQYFPFVTVDGIAISDTAEKQIATGLYAEAYEFVILPNDTVYAIKVYYEINGAKEEFTGSGNNYFDSQNNKYHVQFDAYDIKIIIEVDYKDFTITFKGYNNEVIEERPVSYGTVLTERDLTRLDNYKINNNSDMQMYHVGWYYNGDLYTINGSGEVTTVTSDIELTSKWTKLFTAKFVYENDTLIKSEAYGSAADIELPTVETRSGMTFEGWQIVVNDKYAYLSADGNTLRFNNTDYSLSGISVSKILTQMGETSMLSNSQATEVTDFVITFTTVYSIEMTLAGDYEPWNVEMLSSPSATKQNHNTYFYDIGIAGASNPTSLKVRYGSSISYTGSYTTSDSKTKYWLQVTDPDGKVHFGISFFEISSSSSYMFDKVTLDGTKLTSAVTPNSDFTVHFCATAPSKSFTVSLPYVAHNYFDVLVDLSSLYNNRTYYTYVSLGDTRLRIPTSSEVSLAQYFADGYDGYKVSTWLTYDELNGKVVKIECPLTTDIEAILLVPAYEGVSASNTYEAVSVTGNTLTIPAGVAAPEGTYTLTYTVPSITVTYNVIIPTAVAGANYTITTTYITYDNTKSHGISDVTTENTLTSDSSGTFVIYEDGGASNLTLSVISDTYIVSYVVESGSGTAGTYGITIGGASGISDSDWTIVLSTRKIDFVINNNDTTNPAQKTLGTFPVTKSTTYADLAAYMNENLGYYTVNNELLTDSDFNNVIFQTFDSVSNLGSSNIRYQAPGDVDTGYYWGSTNVISLGEDQTITAGTHSANVYNIYVSIKNPSTTDYDLYENSKYADTYKSGIGLSYAISTDNKPHIFILSEDQDISENYLVEIQFKSNSFNYITIDTHDNDYLKFSETTTFSNLYTKYYKYILNTQTINVNFISEDGLLEKTSTTFEVSALDTVENFVSTLEGTEGYDNIGKTDPSKQYYYTVSHLALIAGTECTGTFGQYLTSTTEFNVVYESNTKHKLRVINYGGDVVYTAYYLTRGETEDYEEWNSVDLTSLMDCLTEEELIVSSIPATKGATGSEFAYFEASDGNNYCVAIDPETMQPSSNYNAPFIDITSDFTLMEHRVNTYYVYYTYDGKEYEYASFLGGTELTMSNIINSFWTATGLNSDNYTWSSIKFNGTQIVNLPGPFTINGETKIEVGLELKEYDVRYYILGELIEEFHVSDPSTQKPKVGYDLSGNEITNPGTTTTLIRYNNYYDIIGWTSSSIGLINAGYSKQLKKSWVESVGDENAIGDYYAVLMPKSNTGDVFVVPEWIEYSDYYQLVTAVNSTSLADYSGESTVILPRYVTTVESGAFKDCTDLKIITPVVPNNTLTLQSSAFEGCSSLTTINHTVSISSGSTKVFKGCSALTTVNKDEIIILDTTVPAYAFYGATKLDANIVSNATDELFTTVGEYGFYNCKSMTSFNLSTSASLNVYALSGSGISGSLDLSGYSGNIRDGVFSGCTSLTSVSYADISGIGDSSFNICTSLTTVSCSSLYGNVGSSAFYECAKLKTLGTVTNQITLNAPQYVYGNAFAYAISGVPVVINNVGCISEFSFLSSNLTSLYVSFTNSAADTDDYTIMSEAFRNCSSLYEVKYSDLRYIGSYAFEGCTSLSKFWDGVSVTSSHACDLESKLAGGEHVNSVITDNYIDFTTFGGSETDGTILAKQIGYRAFANCKNLHHLIAKNSSMYNALNEKTQNVSGLDERTYDRISHSFYAAGNTQGSYRYMYLTYSRGIISCVSKGTTFVNSKQETI